ncbi:MAG: ABC transporter ATP-binding protein [Sphingomonadaceae bacterium]|uniref:ABC transporter ATP-binding protein n=1 Tax=Thermaurantiacus sp. TaxID=2820283 RepID=UPI00298F114F|nr:ABC transporter ATP-binding protein [Thermaurantiacus sp.]MCS6987631.1 ABC transporter ATP-binding protein [Sphingomonadaceae bacterium]MDW8415232.1 ABC transporter ATP-binding protein [Thermaurantiacus sp.]
MSAALRIEHLTKVYAGGRRALDQVSLAVPQGQIFGLLGPNGAGKSTLINILAGLVTPTSGRVEVWGFDIAREPRNARASLGVVPQELVFDAFFTPFETLELQAGLYGIPRARRRTRALLRAVHLEEQAHVWARTLSGGMKRRLLIAKALVHDPPVVILDEPTAGVDVELRQMLWELVRRLHRDGATVVLTTHYLEEAEELCQRIAIIDRGRVVADAPTAELLAMAHEKRLDVVLGTDAGELPTIPGVLRVDRASPRHLSLVHDRRLVSAGRVLAALQQAGLEILDVSTREPDLEDVFLDLTRRRRAA